METLNHTSVLRKAIKNLHDNRISVRDFKDLYVQEKDFRQTVEIVIRYEDGPFTEWDVKRLTLQQALELLASREELGWDYALTLKPGLVG